MAIIRATLILTFAFFLAACELSAEPNHKDPNAYLSVFGDDEAKALYAETTKLATETFAETRQQAEAAEAGRLAKFSGDKLGLTRAKIIRFRRLAAHLEMFGEPSGTELAFRSHFVGPAQNVFVKGFLGLPTSARYLAAMRANLKKQEPARYKAAEQIKKLAEQEKWQAAEELLYQQLDRLNIVTGYLTDAEIRQVLTPFADITRVVDTESMRLRAERAKVSLEKARREQTPDYAGILAEIKQAINNIAATGSTTWKEATVDGPQLVEKIGAAWSEAHVATLRCRALDWAYLVRTQSGSYAEGPGENRAADPLGQAYAGFTADMLQQVVDLLAAETGRVSADGVADLYARYLAALAPLMDQVADRASLKPIDQALHDLANKSPAFGKEVAAYDQGTTELLRWRARAAAAMTRSRETEFAALHKRMFEATKSEDNYVGLFTVQLPEVERPRLLDCAPKIMPPAVEKLLGQKARVGGVQRISPTSRSAIAQFDRRTYANLPAELPLAAEAELLNEDLMVSEQAPALSLAAAMAVDSAAHGTLAAAGGEISGAHLEALITRFATLPTAASGLVPLGRLPTEVSQYLLPQALMRFDLQPAWIQHEHFFVELSAAGAE